jgi:predicted HicB family RNase H-like nuclease
MKQLTTKSQLRDLELNLPDEVIVKLALDAHKRDVSLNTHIIDVLKKEIKNSEYRFEDGSAPQFLTED